MRSKVDAGHRLQRWGIHLLVRPGWDVRLIRRTPETAEATTHPVLHLGNFRMPMRVLGDYGSHVVAQMLSSDVLVVVKEFDPALSTSALYRHPVPWPLKPSDAQPRGLQRTIAGQSGIQKFFSLHGRAFCLYVVLGSHARRHELVAEANQALAHLTLVAPT
jgi:hypothetical protein